VAPRGRQSGSQAKSDPGRRIVRVSYSKAMDRVRIIFDDRTIYVVPRRLLEGLEGAAADALRRIEIDGMKLRWRALDVTHSVPVLLKGIYGSKRWMASLERVPRNAVPGGPMFVSERRRTAARMKEFLGDNFAVMSNSVAGRRRTS